MKDTYVSAKLVAANQIRIEIFSSLPFERLDPTLFRDEVAMPKMTSLRVNRLRDTLLRATNATELFASTQKTAIDAWNENTMLADSAAKKYDTLAAKLTNLKNRALVAGRQIGRDLTPTIENLMEKANNLITSFMGLDKSQRESILKWAAIAAALGPVILVL